MTTDTRSEAERRYDAERDGSLYLAAPVMTDAPAKTIEDINRAQIEAWNGMDQDERLFATIVTTMMDKLPESHRAMGQAGLILLTAACNKIGPEDDGDAEEAAATRIYQAAYTQGYDVGHKQGADDVLRYLQKKLMERGQDGS